MDRIARFEKVSRERFRADILEMAAGSRSMLTDKDARPDEEWADRIYDSIVLPHRATMGSAGYDISTPVGIRLGPGESVRIPTGIRVRMDEGYCLLIMPRSGLGSRFRFQLNNTTGVIDSDYYYSDNEGHIFVPMINDSREGKTVELKAGAAFVQSIFVSFGITEDDCITEERNGGFGSTG